MFWQMGSAPYLGGGFGHFYAYAPEKFEYPINRFAMEVKRQMDVLDRQLAENEFIAGADYSIADMAIWPCMACWRRARFMKPGSFWMWKATKTCSAGKRPLRQGLRFSGDGW